MQQAGKWSYSSGWFEGPVCHIWYVLHRRSRSLFARDRTRSSRSVRSFSARFNPALLVSTVRLFEYTTPVRLCWEFGETRTPDNWREWRERWCRSLIHIHLNSVRSRFTIVIPTFLGLFGLPVSLPFPSLSQSPLFSQLQSPSSVSSCMPLIPHPSVSRTNLWTSASFALSLFSGNDGPDCSPEPQGEATPGPPWKRDGS